MRESVATFSMQEWTIDDLDLMGAPLYVRIHAIGTYRFCSRTKWLLCHVGIDKHTLRSNCYLGCFLTACFDFFVVFDTFFDFCGDF